MARSERGWSARLAWIALLLAVGLIAAACGGGEEEDGKVAPGEERAFSMQICEPESLTPTTSNETCGGQVLVTIFDRLVEYDPVTSQPVNNIAASIESTDDKVWTITLNDGWTFHNGEPVTAQSFVDAWNYGANQENLQDNSTFYAGIEGYADVQCGKVKTDKETGAIISCTEPPTATTMSGLAVVDELTFTATLTDPSPLFPVTLGYIAFSPLPTAFFDDPEAFNEQPIGTGPFQMDGAWQHDVGINVKSYPDYAGDAGAGNATNVEFRIYGAEALNAAYRDLQAGNIDTLDTLPPEQIESAKAEFGDRYYESPSSLIQAIAFPLFRDEYGDVKDPAKGADIRHALSMAIDRQTISDKIFLGTRVPADDFITPVVPGYREGACGEFCEYDPEAAKALFDQAGGLPEGFTVEMWFNNDGGHEAWMEAIANGWSQTLGVKAKFGPSLNFDQFLGAMDAREGTGPMRAGWVFDYPSPQNYLKPIYGTGASSNWSGYSSADFDGLIAQGEQAGLDEGITFYQQADDVLLQDMPATPALYGVNNTAYSDRISNVVIDAYSFTRIKDVVVNA